MIKFKTFKEIQEDKMKRFKELTEELLNEGGEMYPADEMTISELKIACYSAQNILERLEEGAMIQRWQISAIVKAKEELAAVYTAMSADEGDDDEWEDEMDDEEPMYVGFEYHSMYGEEVELDENIGGLFKNASEWESSAKARGLVVKSMTHPSGEMIKYQIAKDKQGNNRGHFDHGTKSGRLKEEVELDEVSDLQKSIIDSIQKKLKKSSSLRDPNAKTAREEDRIAKMLAAKAKMKKEEVEQIDELSKETLKSYAKKADKQADKASQSYSNAAARRHDFAPDTPAMAKNAKKFAKRDAGSALAKDKLAKMEEVDLEEADGTKRNRELLATGRISKDEFDKRMGYGKYKTKDNSKKLDGPGGLYKNLVKRLGEEVELDEISYRDQGYQNMMKASAKADKEVDKMRAQAAKRAEKEAAKKKPVEEETDYEVDVEGLPKMYVKANNPGEVKNSLRKIVKNPEMIKNVERIAKASLQKMFRDKASGKEE